MMARESSGSREMFAAADPLCAFRQGKFSRLAGVPEATIWAWRAIVS